MFIAKTLSFYKKPEVKKALLKHAEHKEIAVRFNDYFGKRPEALFNEGDVLEFAKKKATSFHASEELWINPLQLKSGLKQNEINDLRIGWDLILDVDCPYWPLSKLITHLFIKAIKAHGIRAVTVKFSGNKGFHIAVPFESFPETINGKPTKNLFPETPRRVAQYLLDYITKHYLEDKGDYFLFDKKYRITKEKLAEKMNLMEKTIKEPDKWELLCPKCGFRKIITREPELEKCPKCGTIMNYNKISNPKNFRKKQNQTADWNEDPLHPLKFIEVDTILIAHRHLYRMPYSFHEKSRLVSVPIPIDEVLNFSKKQAVPEKIRFDIPFLDRTKARKGEASKLLIQAYDFQPKIIINDNNENKEFEIPEEALPETTFPPCIKNILKGLKDGRKRSLFTLINFLRGVGWSYDLIEERIKQWNKANDEPLREVIIKGQINYSRKKKPLPPHNCKSYYQDLGVCQPDNICASIKNPLQYAKKKARLLTIRKNSEKKKRTRLSEEQKKMRRAYREKKKKQDEK